MGGSVPPSLDRRKAPWLSESVVRALPLADGDLAIGGVRIDRASPDTLGAASSIATERHLAINWICYGPELYSGAQQST